MYNIRVGVYCMSDSARRVLLCPRFRLLKHKAAVRPSYMTNDRSLWDFVHSHNIIMIIIMILYQRLKSNPIRLGEQI